MSYTISLTQTEYDTLCWLADHGYDADLLNLADLVSTPEEHDSINYVLSLTESAAWTFNENIEADPDAYLACNGSRGLMDKLAKLEDSIV